MMPERHSYAYMRTKERLRQVEKNSTAEFADRQYKPGDRVDFFKNTVNPKKHVEWS